MCVVSVGASVKLVNVLVTNASVTGYVYTDLVRSRLACEICCKAVCIALNVPVSTDVDFDPKHVTSLV